MEHVSKESYPVAQPLRPPRPPQAAGRTGEVPPPQQLDASPGSQVANAILLQWKDHCFTSRAKWITREFNL